MKALAIMRPAREGDLREEVMTHAGRELTALWALYRDGVVREMYSPGGLGAVLVLEVASLPEAHEALSRLPLIEEGLMTPEVIELAPFAALQMLFRPADGGR